MRKDDKTLVVVNEHNQVVDRINYTDEIDAEIELENRFPGAVIISYSKDRKVAVTDRISQEWIH